LISTAGNGPLGPSRYESCSKRTWGLFTWYQFQL